MFLQWQDGKMDFHKEKSECIFLHNTHACRRIYQVSSVHYRYDGRQEWVTCDINHSLCIDEIKISRELSYKNSVRVFPIQMKVGHMVVLKTGFVVAHVFYLIYIED